MTIDLLPIIKDYGGQLPLSGELTLEDTEFLGELFVFDTPVKYIGRIMNNTKSLELSLTVSGRIRIHCARCMKPFAEDFKFELTEILLEEGQEISENDEVILFSGHSIELDEIILNNFLMNVRGKYLCSEACRGLCPVCGIDLNTASCNCQKEEIDPRWAALAEIMSNTSDTE